jgi:hypothetical protein
MMHYQAYRDHKYLGEWDFAEGDRLVTIDRVEQGLIERDEGPPERAPFMYLREFERPMIVNSTNGALIAAMYGSPDTREWEGKRIWLTRGMTTNKQGQPCFAIRVKPMRPAPIEEKQETAAEQLARLEAELAKARAAVQSAPRELSEKPPETSSPAFVEETAVLKKGAA